MKTFIKFVQIYVACILVDDIAQIHGIRFQHIPQQNILKVIPVRPARKLQKQPVPKQIHLNRQPKHPISSLAEHGNEDLRDHIPIDRKVHSPVQVDDNPPLAQAQHRHVAGVRELRNRRVPIAHNGHQIPIRRGRPNARIPVAHRDPPNQPRIDLQAGGPDRNIERHATYAFGPPPPRQFTFLNRPTFYQKVRKYFSKPTGDGSSPTITTVVTTVTTTTPTPSTSTAAATQTKPISYEYVPLEERKAVTKHISSEQVGVISEEKSTKRISSEYVPLESAPTSTKHVSSEYVPLVSLDKTTKHISSEYVPLVSDEEITKRVSSEYLTDKPAKAALVSEEFVSDEDTKPVTRKAKRDDSSSYDSDGEKRRLNRLSTFSYELEFYDAADMLNLTGDQRKFFDENREEIMRNAFPPENITRIRNFTHEETVRAFFNYEKIEDKYMPFFKWYYRVLTNPQHMKELYNRTVVEELDYKNISKYTPFPIPEHNQHYFMFINHLEEEIKREQEEERIAQQEKQQVEQEWDKILQDVDEDVVDDVDEDLSLAAPSMPPTQDTTTPSQAPIPQTKRPAYLQEPGLRRQAPPNLQPNDARSPLQADKQTNKPPLVRQLKDSKENLFG